MFAGLNIKELSYKLQITAMACRIFYAIFELQKVIGVQSHYFILFDIGSI